MKDDDYPGQDIFQENENESNYPDLSKLFSSKEELKVKREGTNVSKNEDFYVSFDRRTSCENEDDNKGDGNLENAPEKPWMKDRFKSIGYKKSVKKTSEVGTERSSLRKHRLGIARGHDRKLAKENKDEAESPSIEAESNLEREGSLKQDSETSQKSEFKKKSHVSSEVKRDKENWEAEKCKSSNIPKEDSQIEEKVIQEKSRKENDYISQDKNKNEQQEKDDSENENASLQSQVKEINKERNEQGLTNSHSNKSLPKSESNSEEEEDDEVQSPASNMKQRNTASSNKDSRSSLVASESFVEMESGESDRVRASHEQEDEAEASGENNPGFRHYTNLAANRGFDPRNRTDPNLVSKFVLSGELSNRTNDYSNISPITFPIPEPKPLNVLGASDILARPPIKEMFGGVRKSLNFQPIAEKQDENFEKNVDDKSNSDLKQLNSNGTSGKVLESLEMSIISNNTNSLKESAVGKSVNNLITNETHVLIKKSANPKREEKDSNEISDNADYKLGNRKDGYYVREKKHFKAPIFKKSPVINKETAKSNKTSFDEKNKKKRHFGNYIFNKFRSDDKVNEVETYYDRSETNDHENSYKDYDIKDYYDSQYDEQRFPRHSYSRHGAVEKTAQKVEHDDIFAHPITIDDPELEIVPEVLKLGSKNVHNKKNWRRKKRTRF